MRADADDAATRKTHRIARQSIADVVSRYLASNEVAKRALTHAMRVSGATMEDLADDGLARLAPLDHIAYRSFAHEDYGVEGVCEVFERLGWETVSASEGGRLEFTEKRVRARWMKPPKTPRGETPLPRIFVSELVVDACDEELKGYLTQHFERVGEGKVLRSMEWAKGRNARWQLPPASVYAKVERLSEYASWTLLHGYAVNHVALSLFQLRKMYPETPLRTLEDLETSFASNAAFSRIKWNESGGRIKRSPSGLLAQSALMSVPHRYGLYKKTIVTKTRYDREEQEDIFKDYGLPGSYLEFVQRLPKPQNADKSFEELEECDLREGFETGNASKIFDSTSTRPPPPSGAGSSAPQGGAPPASNAPQGGGAPPGSNAPKESNAPGSSEPAGRPAGMLMNLSSRVASFFRPSSQSPVKKPRVEEEGASASAPAANDDVIDLT